MIIAFILKSSKNPEIIGGDLKTFGLKYFFYEIDFEGWSAHLDELLPEKATKPTVNKGNGHENIDALYEASD